MGNMNKELQEEAEKYLDRNYNLSYEKTTWQKLHEKTFIAGATSKYVEKEKLEFALKQLLEAGTINFEGETNFVYQIALKVQELQKQLKKLENE